MDGGLNVQMIGQLARATLGGRISWSADDDEVDIVFTTQVGSALLLLGTIDHDNQRPYYLSIGRSGQPHDSMETLRQVFDAESTMWFPLELDELWEAARRSAYGLDAVISELQAFLDETV